MQPQLYQVPALDPRSMMFFRRSACQRHPV
jgi:hypothetical protein